MSRSAAAPQLLCFVAIFLFVPLTARPTIVVPPQPADKVNLTIVDNATFDPQTAVYTYTYEITNKQASQQNLWYLAIETGALISSISSPSGWTFTRVLTGSRALVSWAATELPDNGTGNPNVPESPATAKPGETITISFQSPNPPTTGTLYAQGFVPMPEVDFSTGEVEIFTNFNSDLFDVKTNSYTRNVTAPSAECNDGVDNDSDGDVDSPADSGCLGLNGPTENPACDDGVDNDGDGLVDFPADPECALASDFSEGPDCSDGFDNDFDGAVDFPADPSCASATDLSEVPDCGDFMDNDGDGLTDDYGLDPGCPSRWWPSEQSQCDDNVDNDGDGFVDFGADDGCTSAYDLSELRDCSDGQDNDGDGLIDLNDGGCRAPADPSETEDCRDGIDNDGDGLVDFPEDDHCQDFFGVREQPSSCGLLGIEVLLAYALWRRLAKR